MTIIRQVDYDIECIGHAGDKICCAMLTALTVSLVKNLTERLNDNPDYVLESGYFRIDTRTVGVEGSILVDAYLYALKGLAESYPDNFVFE